MAGSESGRWHAQMKFVCAALLLAVGISGCSGSRVSDADVRSAYKVEAGPLPIAVEYRAELDFPALD